MNERGAREAAWKVRAHGGTLSTARDGGLRGGAFSHGALTIMSTISHGPSGSSSAGSV